MPIMFNTLLDAADLPLPDVRLVRHKDNRSAPGRTPYDLWRDDRPKFELYQSNQSIGNRAKFQAKYWAVFLGTPNDETLFVGIYGVKYRGLLKRDMPMPQRDGVDKAGTCDTYNLKLLDPLSDLIGKLLIDWGPGALAWVQYADRHNKPVTELRREFKEPDFPGFLNFMEPLSRLNNLPKDWVTALRSSRGVYLLTCPKTKEQYVGSATGHDGFWGRWLEYVQNQHGGNKGLKSRKPSDYQVSILEVAGTALKRDDILHLEEHWKLKLQSKEMGLNR